MGTDTFLGQGSSLRKPVKEKDWVNIYEHETSVTRGQIETRWEDINRGGKGGGEIGEDKHKEDGVGYYCEEEKSIKCKRERISFYFSWTQLVLHFSSCTSIFMHIIVINDIYIILVMFVTFLRFKLFIRNKV